MTRSPAVAALFALTLGVGFLLPLTQAAAGSGTAIYEDENGLAVGGYDVVAITRTGEAVLGKMRYRSRYDGAVYAFTSLENQEAFGADPIRFLPAYGGYCAYGVRLGRKSPINPSIFEIVDGQVHFFLNPATKFAWDESRKNNKHIADRNWQKMVRHP